MTRDDVIRMAEEAGLVWNMWRGGYFVKDPNLSGEQALMRFAALLAAHVLARTPPPPIVLNTADIDPELLRDLLAKARTMPIMPMPPEPDVAAAVAAEREACALACEQSDRFRGAYFAEKIRARGRA